MKFSIRFYLSVLLLAVFLEQLQQAEGNPIIAPALKVIPVIASLVSAITEAIDIFNKVKRGQSTVHIPQKLKAGEDFEIYKVSSWLVSI